MIKLNIYIPHIQGKIFFCYFQIFIIQFTFPPSKCSSRSALRKEIFKLFYDVMQNYGCLEKLYTINLNKTSTNVKMAQELLFISPHFHTKMHLLGCIDHVINLGKKFGLAVLGTIKNNDGEEILRADIEPDSKATNRTANLMSISQITCNTNGIGINIVKTILKMPKLPNIKFQPLNLLKL
ncbi:uncharacterized protein VP01_769g1 [Puccinia sorghi]|uniref:Uncharacterized protein n=1 Tax=Puccinia sorghi TaxID=27349 RepID=A0A0L6UCG0_9BASI|nr:uncharacterized protein VP01_769g1 [Puccinia sorghi]